jgi:transposase
MSPFASQRAIRSAQIIEFLKHLLRYIPGDILLIWDRLPAHRSLITQQFIRDQKGRLAMEYLPPYAPERLVHWAPFRPAVQALP